MAQLLAKAANAEIGLAEGSGFHWKSSRRALTPAFSSFKTKQVMLCTYRLCYVTLFFIYVCFDAENFRWCP